MEFFPAHAQSHGRAQTAAWWEGHDPAGQGQRTISRQVNIH